jgi:glycosyltransferase involved in cell wall biosynthesis
VAFGGFARGSTDKFGAPSFFGKLIGRFRTTMRNLRYLVGPLSLPLSEIRFRKLVEEIHPDLVHALRIPFEGMLAAVIPGDYPLVVSAWGNDFTLHAHGSFLMKLSTRKTMLRADGLVADASRDIRLGQEWGFSQEKPTLVVPGGGGIRLEEIDSTSSPVNLPEDLPDVPIVINPRGQRPGSLRQDVFFQSIPQVLEKHPTTLFICPSLAGDLESENWVESLKIRDNTRLWPRLERPQLWQAFKTARVYVSPSLHDGTPNSLLEAMACGCFPVVGNIESLKEWVTHGVNGLLVDATSPRSLADGIITALENPGLCTTAKKQNALIIAERATYQRCMAMTEAFYQKLITVN